MVSGPEDIFRMFQGYQATAILKTGLDLGIFDALAKGAADSGAVAAAIRADARATEILLQALAGLGLIEFHGGKYKLGVVADTHLVSGKPAYLGDARNLFVSAWMWEGFTRLKEAVKKGGAVIAEPGEVPNHPFWEDFAKYSTAVAGPQSQQLAQILSPWASSRNPLHVLDIACGTGLYGYSLAKAQPHAQIWSLDWPNVLNYSRGYAEKLGVLPRVKFIEGDAFEVKFGGPYDVVILSHFFHHFSEERCAQMLKKVAAAMKPGGKVAIHEFVAIDEPAKDPFPRLFSVMMLVWTQEGKAHSLDTYDRMLADAGFGKPQLIPSPGVPGKFLIADKK